MIVMLFSEEKKDYRFLGIDIPVDVTEEELSWIMFYGVKVNSELGVRLKLKTHSEPPIIRPDNSLSLIRFLVPNEVLKIDRYDPRSEKTWEKILKGGLKKRVDPHEKLVRLVESAHDFALCLTYSLSYEPDLDMILGREREIRTRRYYYWKDKEDLDRQGRALPLTEIFK